MAQQALLLHLRHYGLFFTGEDQQHSNQPDNQAGGEP